MNRLRVHADAGALGDALAAEIIAVMTAAAQEGRHCLLGCPGGRSLMSTYQAVAARLRARPMDLGHVVIVMMDEYLEDAPGPARRVPAGLPHSCARFGREQIARPWNLAVAPHRGIGPEQVWLPDPADPADYDRRLAAAGGIDLFLLATGASDGHVAFNPPGSRLTDRTRVVHLAASTRRDNLATFPHFAGLAEVPRRGVSVGPATIAELSREVRLVAVGEAKAPAVARIAAAGGWDPDWPSTVVHACRRGQVWVDRAAAGGPG